MHFQFVVGFRRCLMCWPLTLENGVFLQMVLLPFVACWTWGLFVTRDFIVYAPKRQTSFQWNAAAKTRHNSSACIVSAYCETVSDQPASQGPPGGCSICSCLAAPSQPSTRFVFFLQLLDSAVCTFEALCGEVVAKSNGKLSPAAITRVQTRVVKVGRKRCPLAA